MPAPNEGLIKVKVSEIVVGEHFRKDLGDLLSLANSINKNGLINAIVIDSEKKLVAGKRRFEAVKMLKWEEIECRIYETLSPFERRKVEIEEDLAQKKVRSWQEEVALKKELHDLFVAERGEEKRKGKHGKKAWSQQDTADHLGIAKTSLSEDLRLAEALELYPELKSATTKKDALRKMYAMREIALLQAIARKSRELGLEVEEDVSLKLGDAYILLRGLPDESFDLCITDPPWGIEIQLAGSARSLDYTEFKDTREVWFTFLEKALPEIFRVLKEGSHFWLFFGPEFYKETRDALEKVGFDVRYVPVIWIKEKPNFTDFEYKPMPQYESIFFAVRRRDKTKTPRRLNEATSDVLSYARTPVGRIHRTEKPLELIKRLISLSTAENDKVLDPFAGSASTLCAALVLRRRALGFECNKEIFESAEGRLRMMMAEITTEAEAEEPAEK